MKFVSIDIETTGLESWCQILEFAAVIADYEQVHATFHRVIKWDKIIGEPIALKMNAELLVKDGINLNELIPQYEHFIRDHLALPMEKVVVAGKNFGMFDNNFLRPLGFKCKHRLLDPAMLWLDCNDEAPPSLAECMKRAGMEGVVPHNALDDAMIVVELIQKGVKANQNFS